MVARGTKEKTSTTINSSTRRKNTIFFVFPGGKVFNGFIGILIILPFLQKIKKKYAARAVLKPDWKSPKVFKTAA